MTEPQSVVSIQLSSSSGLRRCGDCQLCCRLVPTPEIDKPGNTKCKHQRHGVGCVIYATRPASCRFWTCRWLVNDDTADLRRPDRSHYVVDVIPDYITSRDNRTGAERTIPVVQVWCDPKHREAHRDPALRRYIERRAEEGWATLVRFDHRDALFIVAPPMSHDGQWQETSTMTPDNRDHSLLGVVDALASGS
jgi:hypothetical protein